MVNYNTEESVKDSSASSIKIFENADFGKIRVTGTNDNPLFCLSDICRVLEIKNVSDCKSRLDQRGIVLADTPTTNQFGAEVIQPLLYVNEKNLYKVIMRSDKPQAEPFQDWVCGEVLPTIRKTGSYTLSNVPQVTVTREVSDWIEGMARVLNLDEVTKLSLFKQWGEPRGLPVPDYVESEGVTHSASELLKRHGINLSPQAFNKLLEDAGIIETKERRSSKGKMKVFRCITEKGSEYGKNFKHPNNPGSVQPHYYDSKFPELLRLVGFGAEERKYPF